MSAAMTGLICVLATMGLAPRAVGEMVESGRPSFALIGVNVVTTGWIVEARVNGEPAFYGGQVSGYLDITSFVVDGANVVALTAMRDERVSRGPSKCEVNVMRMPSGGRGTAEILGGIAVAEARSDKYEAEVRFSAAVPFRWSWQDCDDLVALTDKDRSEIAAVVRTIADRWRARDVRALMRFGIPWAEEKSLRASVGDRARVDYSAAERQLRGLVSAEPFEVLVSPEASWKYLEGRKLVQLCVLQPADFWKLYKDEDRRQQEAFVLYAGYPRERRVEESGERPPYILLPRVIVVKKAGVWTALNARWEP